MTDHRSPLPPPMAARRAPPGWYQDPWGVAHFRWWDGRAWAANVAYPRAPAAGAPRSRRPRLPAWLSVPVLVAGVLLVPVIVIVAVIEPRAPALALVPLVFIVPVLVWIDRLEPEPWASRLHAFAWGATISVLVAAVVNSIVMLSINESVGAVVSAPLIEETMKGLGILWAVRRREVDGAVDGIVYAGWVGAGFAMVENVDYFLVASEDGVLAETFVARALLTPFAHPLFTAWIGLAVGLAISRRGRVGWGAIWGWFVAVGLHAAWNGSIVAAIATDDARIIVVAALAFVGVFAITIVMVLVVRRAERRAYLAAMPFLAERYGIPADELGMFTTWSGMLAHRRRLPRGRRRRFDDLHAALARLAALHARRGVHDEVEHARLAAQLADARAAMR